jgi:serine protease
VPVVVGALALSAVAALAPAGNASTERAAVVGSHKITMPPVGAKPDNSVVFGKLAYGGGIGGVGVETNAKVYLVFWGTQWGTASMSGPNLVFTNDPRSAAPYVQNFLRGLFGSQDTWSTSMKQYCQGVAAGATKCGKGTVKVKHPTSTPLVGVWYDNAGAAPTSATEPQLGAEGVRAAQHFGNTTAASNVSTQYVIMSPTGTHPDGFPSTGFCAWHDYAADLGAAEPFGHVALTNMPYVSDAGFSCGQNFVNAGAAGLNDGFSIVEGHEYAETVTDQFPIGGWFTNSGGENGDKCAWVNAGRGAAANITTSTGTFAVQSLFSNNAGTAGNCSIFYATKRNQH